jgi:hypothetical protein
MLLLIRLIRYGGGMEWPLSVALIGCGLAVLAGTGWGVWRGKSW